MAATRRILLAHIHPDRAQLEDKIRVRPYGGAGRILGSASHKIVETGANYRDDILAADEPDSALAGDGGSIRGPLI